MKEVSTEKTKKESRVRLFIRKKVTNKDMKKHNNFVIQREKIFSTYLYKRFTKHHLQISFF